MHEKQCPRNPNVQAITSEESSQKKVRKPLEELILEVQNLKEKLENKKMWQGEGAKQKPTSPCDKKDQQKKRDDKLEKKSVSDDKENWVSSQSRGK